MLADGYGWGPLIDAMAATGTLGPLSQWQRAADGATPSSGYAGRAGRSGGGSVGDDVDGGARRGGVTAAERTQADARLGLFAAVVYLVRGQHSALPLWHWERQPPLGLAPPPGAPLQIFTLKFWLAGILTTAENWQNGATAAALFILLYLWPSSAPRHFQRWRNLR